MWSSTPFCLLAILIVYFTIEIEAQRSGGRGRGGRGGESGSGGRGGGGGGLGRGGWGWGRGRVGGGRYSSGSRYRSSSSGGVDLVDLLLFGSGRGGYGGYSNYGEYSGYGNYYGQQQSYCRVAQFVDYVGYTPRYYCDCPPYPPNYQWNNCSPMYGK